MNKRIHSVPPKKQKEETENEACNSALILAKLPSRSHHTNSAPALNVCVCLYMYVHAKKVYTMKKSIDIDRHLSIAIVK